MKWVNWLKTEIFFNHLLECELCTDNYPSFLSWSICSWKRNRLGSCEFNSKYYTYVMSKVTIVSSSHFSRPLSIGHSHSDTVQTRSVILGSTDLVGLSQHWTLLVLVNFLQKCVSKSFLFLGAFFSMFVSLKKIEKFVKTTYVHRCYWVTTI